MMRWLGTPEDRILSWREFRGSIADQSPEEAALTIAQEWGGSPSVRNYYLDLDESFPDPWQLLVNNRFDNLARALGMYYTAAMCKQFNRDQCCIEIYQNAIGERLDIASLDQGKYVLNIHRGQVLNINSVPEHFRLIRTYQHNF